MFLAGERDEVADAARFEGGGGLKEVEFEVDVAALVVRMLMLKQGNR